MSISVRDVHWIHTFTHDQRSVRPFSSPFPTHLVALLSLYKLTKKESFAFSPAFSPENLL